MTVPQVPEPVGQGGGELASLGEPELLDRVTRAQSRVVWAGILAHAATDEQAAAARRVLDEDATVGPLDGLTAGARLVEQVTGSRWLLMRQAREDGASWDRVGDAVGLAGEQARAWYAQKLDAHERHAPEWFDTARARAALDDLEQAAGQDSDQTHDHAAHDEQGDDAGAGW